MLIGHFDDSGTHDHSEVVVWAGFVGSEAQWAAFDCAWALKLAEPELRSGKPPIKWFHMSSCEARTEEFLGYTPAEKDALVHDLRQIIINSGVVGYARAVERKAWDRLITGPYRALFGDAEGYCFRECISFAIRKAQSDPDRAISLTFDDRRDRRTVHQMITASFQRMYDGNPAYPGYPHLRSVAFGSCKMTRPLQAADMLAWETYQVALQAAATGKVEWRPHIRRLIEAGRVTAGLADKQTIQGLFDLFDPNSPDCVGSLHLQ